MPPDPTTQLSKLLSLVLRHKPDEIGITLDPAGWVDVTTLLAALWRHGKPISLQDLQHVVASNEKQRFAFSDDGLRIRASQGHSLHIDLHLAPVTPPEILYHGTTDRFLPAIGQSGLQKMQRQHVHLSATIPAATSVGQRHGPPVVLQIRSGDMHRAGHLFYLSANAVWLTDSVPPQFIAPLS